MRFAWQRGAAGLPMVLAIGTWGYALAGCEHAASSARDRQSAESRDEDSRPASPEVEAAPVKPAVGEAAEARRRPAGRSGARRDLPENGQIVREPAPAARPSLIKRTGKGDEITFDTIKFEMQKGDPFERGMLTPAIESLEGKRVKIRGYILPSFQQSGIKEFVLVRDNMECCFGPGAALYDCIIVKMVPPKTAQYTVRPVAVVGTFHINILTGTDGETLAIYELAGESVE